MNISADLASVEVLHHNGKLSIMRNKESQVDWTQRPYVMFPTAQTNPGRDAISEYGYGHYMTGVLRASRVARAAHVPDTVASLTLG